MRQNRQKNALRILNYTQIELQAICHQIKANKLPVIMMNYAIKAEQLLKAENKILYCILRYPEQFISNDDSFTSPLFGPKIILLSVCLNCSAESISWGPILLC